MATTLGTSIKGSGDMSGVRTFSAILYEDQRVSKGELRVLFIRVKVLEVVIAAQPEKLFE